MKGLLHTCFKAQLSSFDEVFYRLPMTTTSMSRYFQWTLLGCHEYLYVSDWTETLVEAPFGISAFFLKRRSTEHRLSSVRTETHFSKLHLNDLSELSCDLNCKLLGSLNFLSSLILHTLSEELLSHKFLFNLLSTNLFIKIIIYLVEVTTRRSCCQIATGNLWYPRPSKNS